jgi:glycosyltransferase involved in cell wall biosynthesis
MNSDISRGVVLVVAGLRAGGTERVVSVLANYWASDGLKVHIIVLSDPHRPFYEINSHVDISYVPGSQRTSQIHKLKGVYRQVEKLKKMLVVRHGYPIFSFLPHVNILTLIATLGRSARVIVCERNRLDRQDLTIFWRILRVLLYWRAYAVSINLSENTRLLKRFVRSSKILTLPNPVDFPVGARGRKGSEGRLILGVGRLVHQKGFDTLIEAASYLKCLEHGWRIEIFGEGEEKATLQRLIYQYELQSKITLREPIPDIGSVLVRASIMVVPSRFEGLPNALLEALGAGIPCLVSRAAGDLADALAQIDENLVVSDESPEKWAAAIENLVSTGSLRQSMSHMLTRVAAPYEVGTAIRVWNDAAGLTY